MYELYADYVLKNPFYEVWRMVLPCLAFDRRFCPPKRERGCPLPFPSRQIEMPIRCQLFDYYLLVQILGPSRA